MLSIHRKLFLALKKSQYVKNHPTTGSLYLVKKIPPVQFLAPPPLTAIWKTLKVVPLEQLWILKS